MASPYAADYVRWFLLDFTRALLLALANNAVGAIYLVNTAMDQRGYSSLRLHV